MSAARDRQADDENGKNDLDRPAPHTPIFGAERPIRFGDGGKPKRAPS
jgi:hypothetical protein